MPRTDAATRSLTSEEIVQLRAARERAEILYKGEKVPHHSCGAALAVTFSVSPRPYQSLRRGGISGERFCGSIRGGELLLGEFLGDADPTGAVTRELRAAMTWYQEQLPLRFPEGTGVGYICNNLTESLGEFMGPERKGFCTQLTSEVAALTLEAVQRFAPAQAKAVAAAISGVSLAGQEKG